MAGIVWRTDFRDAVTAKYKKACAEAIFVGVEHILTEATKNVPHEEGVLSDSGDTDVDADALAGTVSYGGEASAYCVKQHEDTELTHANGRKAKWLETAFRECLPAVRAKMAATIKSMT